MLYVGIDQHKKYLTICVRNEQGDIESQRQVSTKWDKIDQFLESMQEQANKGNGYVAVIEVCGFNEWLIKRLEQYGCKQVYIIKAPERSRQKTDTRDAAGLSELLWINRDRIAAGKKLLRVSVVYQPTEQEYDDRQATHIRHRLGQALTRTKNSIKSILRRHNLEQECPTKGGFTQAALRWLSVIELPELDRFDMDMRLKEYDLYTEQISKIEARINERAKNNAKVHRLRTMPRVGMYTALAIVAHIGAIERFPHARSLSNYFGITPVCHNSGGKDRSGNITKAGHPFIRFLLAQMVLHALRGDPGLRKWYRQVKRRRGSKIARVAVMRRLCESLWHMLRHNENYLEVSRRMDGNIHKPIRPAA